MFIQDKYLVFTLSSLNYVLVKVLNPFKTSLIIYPLIQSRLNYLTQQEAKLCYLVSKVVGALDNNKRWDILTLRVNILNSCYLFPVSRLNEFSLSMLIKTCNNYCYSYNAYHKAYLIKVIQVIICDLILSYYVMKQLELVPNNLWIFTKGPLVIIRLRESSFQGQLYIHKALYLVFANRLAIL